MKFEFEDLYKFVVSLGVVLISLAVLAPWMFLKESFDLFKTEAELEAVTDLARTAILSRQESVAFILKYIPWFSTIGCVCGTALVCAGLKRWHVNQLLLDEQTKLEVELKKQSIREATKDEIEEEATDEFTAMGVQEKEFLTDNFKSFKAIYTKHEFQVEEKLNMLYSSKYNVEGNKMIGGVGIDFLLRSKSKFSKDWIIEVKSIRKGFNYGWLREVFLKNIYAKNIYSQITQSAPNTILLIVTHFQDKTPDKYAPLITRISEDELCRKGKDRVVMISEEELESLPAETLQRKLGIN